MVAHPELGFYTLAGAPESPRELLDEVRQAEAMGLGACFISERFNIKEASTLSGAAAAVSENLRIITGATNHNTRHPMITASYASTMHFLTGGRFTLGIGRGIERAQDAYGMGRITTAQMEDFAGLMRRLWKGETVVGHDGPAGSWPVLRLDPDAIVLGGGMSNVEQWYERVPQLWGPWVFSDRVDTPLLRNHHGDSSGVRGAAWLGV